MLRETDERFVPWTQETGHAYSHLHHYGWACALAHDKKVLDIGSGEGYGSAILAEVAQSVVGIELAPEVVHHASSHYQRGNLRFVCGDVRALPEDVGQDFDLATCFEVFEHVHEQETLLTETKRRLKTTGVLLLSTPNRVYSDEINHENPHHARELYFDEFWQMLKRNFKNVALFGQNLFSGSAIWDLEKTGDLTELHVGRENDRFKLAADTNPRPNFFLAAVSDGELPKIDARSLLTDADDARVQQQEHTTQEHIRGFRDALRVVKGMQDVQIDRDQQLQATQLSLARSERDLANAHNQIKKMEQQLAEQAKFLSRVRNSLFYRSYKLVKGFLRPKT